MKRTRVFLSFLCSLSCFHPLASKKDYLWIEGTKNLIPLLRTVFTDKRMLEGDENMKKLGVLISFLSK